eukprot:CAMPEP_0172669110 /NCGR_PEP_ID=MMETSP1074-20121228/9477_1 /TAXON_ID=2916 /ORGANISM="Ceratium fusus, Strain PA161109" /LENGTH=1085 /DNA_ID=CAMNT_0013485847 /DNA_START=101 /DNA_END=3358 /DNA_ORIENTATION=+
MAAAQVIGHIHGLHRDFANIQAHSSWLQQFQQAPEAWAVVHELLTSSSEELVQYFASHTLVTKLQAGNVPNVLACRQELMKYLKHFWRGPHAVRRQLVIALTDCALLQPPTEDGAWLADSVQQLSDTIDALPSLLELLATIPEEAANRKVVVPAQRRLAFATGMLQHTGTVLEALWKASQTNEACAVAALRACAKWLHLQHASPALRAQKRAASGSGGSGPFSADLVRQGTAHEHPLLKQAAQTLSIVHTAPLELCRACADLLSEAQMLTNEATPQARALQMLVMQAVVEGSRQLLPLTQKHLEAWMPQDSELTARTAVLGRLIGELGGLFCRILTADARAAALPGEPPVQPPSGLSGPLSDLTDVALHFCALRHTDLAKCGLDFWYAVLAQYLGAAAEEEDPYDEEAAGAGGRTTAAPDWSASRDPQLETQRRSQERHILEPHIQKMVKAHWRAVRYPSEPEHEEHFEWDEFVRFREMCSINVTEACLIVTPRWIIDHIGSILEEICSRQPIAWQDIDACVFMLTGVASRAPAGQDTVIPKLIELLPHLPYHTVGFKALLLRSAASRLILFTSGYLALNPEPCKQILRFLTTQHLPAIPALPQVPDPDVNKYCEALACDAMKMVMTAARKGIVQADGGTLWREVVSAVISLVADPRFNVDCRAQLVFGIGQVLSVLDNWSELEQMLDLFVSRMEEPLAPVLAQLPPEPLGARASKATRDGKAPLELKLYIAAVSSVYNMPPVADGVNRPDHHPVLAVVEKHFLTIEKVCIHHTHYEELMEQVCLAFSYILGFAREYAPTSPVFVPMMKLMARCCEQHPQPFYMGLIRSVIGFFAAAGSEQLDLILVDLTGLFVTPVAHHLGSGASTLPPPINAAAYEMLAEALRHWNLALLAIRSAQWLTNVFDATIEVVARLVEENQAVHERTVCAMLRFVRNILLWGDPETCKGDSAPEVVDLQKQAQALVAERPLPRGVALQRIIVTLARLMAAAAPNGASKGEVVPSTAEVLRTVLTGPFEYAAGAGLPAALRALPAPLGEALSEPDLQRLLQQLKMEKGDNRRFTRTVVGLVDQFAVCIKKAQFSGCPS